MSKNSFPAYATDVLPSNRLQILMRPNADTSSKQNDDQKER